jgi:hypothetical protein
MARCSRSCAALTAELACDARMRPTTLGWRYGMATRRNPPDATGMLAAIVAPLAVGNLPVWVAASFDGDIVLIPVDQVDEASELLRRAGHRVIG